MGQPAGFEIRQQLKKGLTGSTAGKHFSETTLVSSASGLGTLSASSVRKVSRLPGVSAAGGSLALTDLVVSGTVPSAGAVASWRVARLRPATALARVE